MKKLLSLLALALCMASSTWADYSGSGTGTSADPYQIANATQLVEFAGIVNTGGDNMSANAVLTADINMQNVSWTNPIGNWKKVNNVDVAYKGHFDGQGHKIENLEYTTAMNYHGLFGVISTGALIENFSIYGTITSNVATSGVVGYARDATPTIRNVHSYLNINNTREGSRLGGILGSSVNGTIVVDRCTYSGTLDGNDSGGSGNYGGIVGYTNNDSKAHLSVTNCLFDGELKNTAATPGNCTFGGIVGYVGASPDVTITNCMSLGSLQSNVTGLFYGAVKNAACSITNSYYQKQDNSYTINGAASGAVTPTTQEVTLVTNEQLESGEIAFALNGDQTTINWFQTLGDDDFPTPNGIDVVYQNGRKHCDGTTYPDVTYSNTNLGIVTDAHDYVDGICSVCNSVDATYMTANSEGYYEISTPAQLKWFSAWVNSSSDNTSSNAMLTDDIDMTSITATWVPIGDWHTGNVNSAYKGHFNGQGHEISNFNVTVSQTYYGIFGVVSAATIENFSIRGSITNNDFTNIGVIGYSRDTSVNIQNIQSYLTITNNANDKNVGGILGSGNAGTTNINRCAFFGTINADDKTNAGGIVGYFKNGSDAIVNITNCLFEGTISSEISNSYCGGIAGYGGGNVNNVKIINCLSIGILTAPVTGQFFGNIRNVGSSITNCYYQGDNIYGTGSSTLTSVDATPVTDTQLSSGEVCYLLNGDQSTIAWYQTLPATPSGDATPTLDATHEQVYVNGTVCQDTGVPQGTVSYSNTDGTTEGPHVPVDGFCTYCGTLDETYMTPISDYYMIGTPAQLKWFAAYVNQVNPAVNAKLTNITPIDLTGVTIQPIGNADGAYAGIFDGQGKSITGFSATGSDKSGFFGNISGATIKDFSIAGTLTVTGGTGSGVVGWAAGSTISNVHSALVIEVPNSGVHHVGGVVGSARGDNTIDRCSFSGSMTVASGSTDNFGGIVSYVTHTSSTHDEVTNCANYGSIAFSDAGCAAGGILGYINSTAAVVKNCLSTGEIIFNGEGSPKYGGAILGRTKNTNFTKITNNYWLEGSAYGSSKNDSGVDALATESSTTEEFASGEIAYKLGSAWYQTINTDDYPVLDSNSEKVLYVGAAGYSTMYDADNDWELVGDAQAYIGTINGSALHLDEIDDIPAGTAVVISGTYYNKVSTTAAANTEGNKLLGSDGSVSGGAGIYALAQKGEPAVVGFYPVGDGVTIPAGKAYLDLNGSSTVKAFTFVFDDATGIGLTPTLSSKEGEIYNLAGQRIQKMQKGINIVNGKKIAVK